MTQALGGGPLHRLNGQRSGGPFRVTTVSGKSTAVRSGGGIALLARRNVSKGINQSRIVGNTATGAYGGGVYVAYRKSGPVAASLLVQNSGVAEHSGTGRRGDNHANATASAQTSARRRRSRW